MNDIAISSQELREKNRSALPASARELGRYDFWYYTRLSTADKILDSRSFWVSNLCDMNDLDELELHKREREKLFALCFCNSNTEKIPMWYLYSGIAGTGASLGLAPGAMLAFLKSLTTVTGQTPDGGESRLAVGSDVELRFGWVFYRKQKEPGQILYRNKWYTIDDVNAFTDGNYFLKAYPWEYEKEFRLVFINKTKTTFKRLLVPIPVTLCETMKLRLAPELNAAGLKKVKGLKHIGKDAKPTLLFSELRIKMNLFHRNHSSLPDYLREEFSRRKPDVQPEALCQLIRDAACCAEGKS